MSDDDIFQALRQKPFEPFRIQISDGTVYDVRHAELVMVGVSAIIVGIPAVGKVNPVYQRAVTISMGHIVKLLPLRARASKDK